MGVLLGDLGRDAALAGRRLLRTPGFTLAAVLTLALGIGANTALFAVINGVLFKPVPIPIGDRLVHIAKTRDGAVDRIGGPSAAMLAQLQSARTRALAGITWTRQGLGALTSAGRSRIVLGEAVAGSYFGVLDIRPRIGRMLMESDNEPGAPLAVVISERLWRTTFEHAPGVVGQPVRLSGMAATVVGVVPDSFRGLIYPNLLGVDIWLPRTHVIAIAPIGPDGERIRKEGPPGRVFARLAEGVTFAQADAEVRAASARGDPEDPSTGAALTDAASAVVPPQFVAISAVAAAALLSLAGLVLLVVGSNLTSLWLVRLSQRTGELALRVAMGAGGPRLGRMVAVEAALVAALGGLGGAGVAWILHRLLDVGLIPEMGGMRIRPDLSPDWHVMAYLLATVFLVAATTGSVAGNLAARVDPMRHLRSGGSEWAGTGRQSTFRQRLVAAQLAATVVVLIAAVLFTRSLSAAATYDPGFDLAHAAIAQLDVPVTAGGVTGRRAAYDRVLAVALRLPGVTSAALSSGVPAQRGGTWELVLADGQQVGLLSRGVGCRLMVASPGLFGTLGIPLRDGRDVSRTDGANARAVAVVSAGLANELWPGQRAVGHRLRVRSDDRASPALEVVGVVADTDPSSPDRDLRRALYVPLEQRNAPHMALVVRGPGAGAALLEPLRSVVSRAVPDVALYDVRTLGDHVGLAATGLRLAATCLLALGGLALLIAGIGVYGVIASLVTLRTREIGIRRALGAGAWQIQALVARDGLQMLAVGLGLGLALAALGAGKIGQFLVGVSPYDWRTFLLVPALLAAVGLAAIAVPTWRALRVAPSVALREQ